MAIPGEVVGELGSAYALSIAVWTDEGPTGYVDLSHTLDRQDASLDGAYEVPGYPSIQVASGQLFVARNEELSIARFDVTAELDLLQRGALGFVGQGVESVLFGDQYWQHGGTAYLALDVTQRVLWDPASFAIEGILDVPPLPDQLAGLDLFANFNRTSFVSTGDVVRPFSYHDQDWFVWSPSTYIAVYDAETHDVKAIVEAPCPGLDSITRDELGNTYLGSWEYSTLFPLMGLGAAPCAARLGPDNSLDTSWNPNWAELTGGRLLKNFRYLGQGKAIAGVLHAEEYGPDYDFSTFVENTDDFWVREGSFHRLWMFDLDAQTAAPVTGIEFDFVQPYFSHAVIDGRYFVFLADGSSNQAERTVVYELGLDASAVTRFEVAGDVREWVKIR